MMGLAPKRIISLEAKSKGAIDPTTLKPIIVPQVTKETFSRSINSGTQATDASAEWPMRMNVASEAI